MATLPSAPPQPLTIEASTRTKLAVVAASSPVPAILPPAAADLEFATLDRGLRTGLDRARNGLCEVGYYGFRLAQRMADPNSGDSWAAHGYQSEDHYRESLGVSYPMWRDYTSLGAKLAHLALADMQQLTVAAARSLARVRADLWQEFPWLEEAKLLPASQFDDLVKQRQAKSASRVLREPRADIRLAVPASQLPKLEARLEAIRADCSFTTSGEALALALAAAEKLTKLAKTNPAAAQALDRAREEATLACSP